MKSHERFWARYKKLEAQPGLEPGCEGLRRLCVFFPPPGRAFIPASCGRSPADVEGKVNAGILKDIPKRHDMIGRCGFSSVAERRLPSRRPMFDPSNPLAPDYDRMGRCFNPPSIAFKSKNSTTLQLSYSRKDPERCCVTGIHRTFIGCGSWRR